MQNTTPVQACNPFANLLQSESNVPNKVEDSSQTTGSLNAAQRLEINDLLESVFEITTYRENLTSDFANTLGFIYIGELDETNEIQFLSVENLEEVKFHLFIRKIIFFNVRNQPLTFLHHITS